MMACSLCSDIESRLVTVVTMKFVIVGLRECNIESREPTAEKTYLHLRTTCS
jgi:hypothetical protein